MMDDERQPAEDPPETATITTGLHEQPAGVADAERLAAAMRAQAPARPAPPKGKPGAKKPGRPARGNQARPKVEPPQAQYQADLVGAAEHTVAVDQLHGLSQYMGMLRARKFGPQEALSPEENLLRAYTMSPELAEVAADAFVLAKNKILPTVADRPELNLLLILGPWLVGVVVAEIGYWQYTRAAARAASEGGKRGPVRPEGLRQDDAGEVIIGAPFKMPDN